MKVVSKHIFKLVFVIFIQMLATINVCYSQHNSFSSNYILNVSSINPAAIGRDEALDVNFSFRKQWAGFSGSPLTNYITANAMIKRPSVNLGVLVIDDKIGSSSIQNLLGVYAYRIKTRKIKLSFGLQAGVQFSNYNINSLNRVSQTDEVVSANQNRQTSFVAGAGFYFNNKSLFGGLSVPYLVNTTSDFSFGKTPIIFNLGNLMAIQNRDLLRTSILLRRINGSGITTDINATYFFYSKVGLGFSYRVNSAIVGLFEVILNDQFKFSYAYDYSVSKIAKSQNGSHEISLRYLFRKKHNINNPRALNF